MIVLAKSQKVVLPRSIPIDGSGPLPSVQFGPVSKVCRLSIMESSSHWGVSGITEKTGPTEVALRGVPFPRRRFS